MDQLTFTELDEFCEKLHNHFISTGETPSLKEMAYGRMVKTTEEVGELSDAVLDYFGRQRSDKEHNADELALEIADVIIAVSVLAKTFNVNVEEALRIKMAKIQKRIEG
jgi:NTP pyrophosphatase (non-canonical NTP hydrolase)